MRGARLAIIGASMLLAVGCRGTREIVREVPVYVHDTTQTVREVHDSIMIDRVREVVKNGDTVYVTNEVTKTVTKIVTDTAVNVVERPVPVTHTEVVEVEKPLRWWQKVLMWFGVALVAWCGLHGLSLIKKIV